MSTDAERRTVAMPWSPTTGAFFLEKKKHHQYSGVNKAKRYHEKKNASIQDQLDHLGASASRTGSTDQMILFAAAQNRAMQERWEAAQAAKTPTRLRMVIGMKKGKAVDSYFQAIRNKVGKERHRAVRQWQFLVLVKGRGQYSDGEHERVFLDEKCRGAQNKQGLPVLPEERSCACDGEWRSTEEEYIAKLA
jgi:hypothetical protein